MVPPYPGTWPVITVGANTSVGGAALIPGSSPVPLSATVAELQMEVNGQLRSVVYKRFRVTDRSDPWKALLRLSPAVPFHHHVRNLVAALVGGEPSQALQALPAAAD